MRERTTQLELTEKELLAITLEGVIAKAVLKSATSGLTKVEAELLLMALKDFKNLPKEAEAVNLKIIKIAATNMMGLDKT